MTLSPDDIADLEIIDSAQTFDGDGRHLRLGLQAYALGIAHEFDPYFSRSISRVDPLHRRVGTAILFESSGGQVDKVAHLPE